MNFSVQKSQASIPFEWMISWNLILQILLYIRGGSINLYPLFIIHDWKSNLTTAEYFIARQIWNTKTYPVIWIFMKSRRKIVFRWTNSLIKWNFKHLLGHFWAVRQVCIALEPELQPPFQGIKGRIWRCQIRTTGAHVYGALTSNHSQDLES